MSLCRRGFLNGLLGLIGFRLGAVVGGTVREDAHYFDWNIGRLGDEPFTTDPYFAGKLTYGRHNRVTCDGVEVTYATRFVTGPNGWVERAIHDESGCPVTEIRDTWTGRVWRWNDPDWSKRPIRQIKSPDRLKPDGSPVPRYDEYPAEEIIRGNVKFSCEPREVS